MVHLQTSSLLLLHHAAFPQLLEKNGSQGPAVHIPCFEGPLGSLPHIKRLYSRSCPPREEAFPMKSRHVPVLQIDLLWDSLPVQTQPGADVQSCSLTPIQAAIQRQCCTAATAWNNAQCNVQLGRGAQLQATELRCLGLSW